MMTLNDFKNRWNSMPSYGFGYLRIDSEHPVDINIGYANIGQKTLFILDAYQIDLLPSSKSIIAESSKIDNGTWALSFKLIHRENEEAFVRLCWDIVESSRNEFGDPIALIVKRYIMWQKLLTQTRPDIMTSSRQKGLFGELLFLNEFIEKQGAEKAISSWSGPEGADQDFTFDETWVEVKAITLSSETVSISSLEQLDTINEGQLIIFRIEKTTPEDKIGKTLINIIEDIKLKLIDRILQKDHFENKLFLYGYKDNPEYGKIYYKNHGDLRYKVSEDFPKLTKKNIPKQISFTKYGLNIAMIAPYKI